MKAGTSQRIRKREVKVEDLKEDSTLNFNGLFHMYVTF